MIGACRPKAVRHPLRDPSATLDGHAITSETKGVVVEYIAVVTQPNQQHTIIKPDPRPYRPIADQHPSSVPDGGAGWAFVLAAVITIGLAALKRRSDRNSWKAA